MNESEINEVWRRMIKVDQIHSEVVWIQYSKKQYFMYIYITMIELGLILLTTSNQ